jgi:hypothetical protein
MTFAQPTIDTILRICGGNPGAINTCSRLVQAGHAETVLAMERLGLRGPDVWIAYKDLGDVTLETLVETIASADIVQRLGALGYGPEAAR